MKIFIGPEEQEENFERQVEIHIDNYDTWILYDTLALIIVPCLKQLKKTTNGAPHVDNEDVPEELHMPDGYDPYTPEGVDEKWFDRWDYVLDEMIWAFEHIQKDEYWNLGPNKIKKIDERIQNGLRLFAKYYRGLWD